MTSLFLCLLNRIRRAYRSLIIDHAAFVYDAKWDSRAADANDESIRSADTTTREQDYRDIAGLLWKSCFYKQIAEFRTSLRKHSAHLDSLVQASHQAGDDVKQLREQEQAERLYIARLNHAFLGFLADSVAFYQKMVAEVRVHCVF